MQSFNARSGRRPSIVAAAALAAISVSLQRPMPVSRSGVMLDARAVNGSSGNSMPPASSRPAINCPSGPRGVWQLPQATIEVNDHDLASMGSGMVIPHGIYDVGLDRGFVHRNTSHDTSELACDSVATWWEAEGRSAYPRAGKLLVLCDGGGSNSATRYVFKEELQKLADRLGLEIRVAHYPPYCSKYNPIERRMFCHVTRACQGVLFDSVGTVKRLIEGARTEKGLCVTVGVSEKEYEVGRKYTAGFKESMKIAFDDHLPKWNYRALPSAA